MNQAEAVAALQNCREPHVVEATNADCIALVTGLMNDDSAAFTVALTAMTDSERLHVCLTLSAVLSTILTTSGGGMAALLAAPG